MGLVIMLMENLILLTVRGKTNDQIGTWSVSAVGGRDVKELDYEPASEELPGQ